MTFGKTARDAVINAIKTTQNVDGIDYTINIFDEQVKTQLPNLSSNIGLSYKWIADNIPAEEMICTSRKRHYMTILSLNFFCEQDDDASTLERKADRLVESIIDDLWTDLPAVLSTYNAKLRRIGAHKDISEIKLWVEQIHFNFDIQIVYEE